MILACQNISKSFGEVEVLKNINFHIEERDKLAIVGVNGAGKTTLLRILLGESRPDNGTVVRAKDIRIGYLSQHQDISFQNTVYQEMEQAKGYLIRMEQRLRELEEEMKHLSGDELDKVLETYNRLSTRYDRENGYAYESEITGVLKGLGFSESDYDRDIQSLSGGQKMRIALGQLLLSHPDVILLDEPTNHLDMPSIHWLEGFLSGYPGAVIVVSHDRLFIDRVSNQILEIELGRSTLYRGNYSFYREQSEKKRQDAWKAYLNQQAEIRHEEDVIRKLKQFNREKSIKRAESREKMLDKIDRIDRPEEVHSEMRLTLTPVTESGEDVLFAEHLAKAYGENKLFEELGIDIKRGEHVALISTGRPEWNYIDMGVQMMGAVLLPIYPTISESEYLYILNHAEVRFLIVEGETLYKKISSIRSQLPSLEEVYTILPLEGVPSIDDLYALGESHRDPEGLQAIKDSISTDDVATMIYTSGSTGTPKGVMLAHRGILLNVLGIKDSPGKTWTRALSWMPLCHIYERMMNYLYQYLCMETFYAESIAKVAENAGYIWCPNNYQYIDISALRDSSENLAYVKSALREIVSAVSDTVKDNL